MSDCFIRFIPENIFFTLSQNDINIIKGFNWDGSIPKLISLERIQFADAGQNFEHVNCASCKVDLTEWWSNAMSSAYSDEHGFLSLEITTPCCSTDTSLHNLEYSFPQGFYKTMIEIMPEFNSQIIPEEILNNLKNITKENWRVIRAHY